MHKKMKGQQDIKRIGAWVTASIQPSVNEFVRLKLTEYGWFNTGGDNAKVARKITDLLLSLYLRARHGEAFHVLFDGQAQTDFALEISTQFLNLDPAPDDPGLLSFVHSIAGFCQDFRWGSNEILPLSLSSESASVSMDTQEAQAISNPEGILGRFFEVPSELRRMIYKEALIAPEGTLVRSFTPPPLLCASRRLRNEALPLFYRYNHFEITVKHTPADTTLPLWLNVERRVWQRFLNMWKVFDVSGTNGLQYVERLTVIYQSSVEVSYPFLDEGTRDRRLGFRFSRAPLEGFVEGRSEEVIRNRRKGRNEGSNEGSDEESDDDNRDGVLRRNVVLLDRATLGWPSGFEAERLLFDQIHDNENDNRLGLWAVYPLGMVSNQLANMLTNMLSRCARDCPQAAGNVVFLCEEFQHRRKDDEQWAEYGTYPA